MLLVTGATVVAVSVLLYDVGAAVVAVVFVDVLLLLAGGSNK